MPQVTFNGTTYEWVQCYGCGIWFVVPQIVYETHRRQGGYHHCPSGHAYGWKQGQGEDAWESLRRERDNIKQQMARVKEERNNAYRCVEQEAEARRKAERELKTVQKRIHAGVCPCCNRTFANVQRHMQSKHPDVPYVPAKKQVAPVPRPDPRQARECGS